MFGTYIIVAKVACLIGGKLYYLLCLRGKRYVSRYNGRRAGLDDLLHLKAYRLKAQAEVLQYRGGHPFAFFNEPQEYMFCTDIIVVESLRFFLSEYYDLPGPFGES